MLLATTLCTIIRPWRSPCRSRAEGCAAEDGARHRQKKARRTLLRMRSKVRLDQVEERSLADHFDVRGSGTQSERVTSAGKPLSEASWAWPSPPSANAAQRETQRLGPQSARLHNQVMRRPAYCPRV